MDNLKIIMYLRGYTTEVELIPAIYTALLMAAGARVSLEGFIFDWKELSAIGGALLKKHGLTLSDVVK